MTDIETLKFKVLESNTLINNIISVMQCAVISGKIEWISNFLENIDAYPDNFDNLTDEQWSKATLTSYVFPGEVAHLLNAPTNDVYHQTMQALLASKYDRDRANEFIGREQLELLGAV